MPSFSVSYKSKKVLDSQAITIEAGRFSEE